MYDAKRLRDRWNGDLTRNENVTEKEIVIVFDRPCANFVMNMRKYISENYGGVERIYIDKNGDEIVSSFRLLIIAHTDSGFDSGVVLNSLVKTITELKTIKSARSLKSLSFRSAVKKINTVEVPQYIKVTCTKNHLKSFSEKVVEDTDFNLNFLNEKLNTRLNNKTNFSGLRHFWEPYLKLDVLCLASLYDRHSMEIQKMSGFGVKDCLTEVSLGWKCFGKYNKDRKFYTFNNKYVKDLIRKSLKRGRVAS